MSSPESPTNEKSGEQIEKLFGHCFEISRIEDSDLVPVGGESQFSQEANIKVLADFENLREWFEKMQERKDKIISAENLMVWAESRGLDRNIFSSIASFTKTFGEVYVLNPKPELSRQDLYRQAGQGGVKLSDVFKGGVAECAEIAMVAQYELQRQGINSKYFSGDVLWGKEDEFSEEHSFIVIRQGDKTLIFDPANPVNTEEGRFPSVYTVEADFNQEVRGGKKKFITAKNVLSGKNAYFGVNDGTNVSEKNIVSDKV